MVMMMMYIKRCCYAHRVQKARRVFLWRRQRWWPYTSRWPCRPAGPKRSPDFRSPWRSSAGRTPTTDELRSLSTWPEDVDRQSRDTAEGQTGRRSRPPRCPSRRSLEQLHMPTTTTTTTTTMKVTDVVVVVTVVFLLHQLIPSSKLNDSTLNTYVCPIRSYRRVVTSLSDVHWKHSCSLSTSVSSALEVFLRQCAI